MADDPARNGNNFDPMEPWRGMRDIYMDTWSKTMVDLVNSDAYGQATGAVLDSYLTVSNPFREAVEKAMIKTLEQLAMPSRADVISIAERMTNIEMRLDDLDARLDGIQRLLLQAVAKPAPQRKAAPQTSSRHAKPAKQAKKAVKAVKANGGK